MKYISKSVKSVASYFTYFYCANYGIYANMEGWCKNDYKVYYDR